MVVLARLRFLRSRADAGVSLFFTFSTNPALGRHKIQITYNDATPRLSLAERPMILAMLSFVERSLDDYTAVDRGHRHSDGLCETCLWLSPRCSIVLAYHERTVDGLELFNYIVWIKDRFQFYCLD